MGTRSLTYVYSEHEENTHKPLVCMYRQFDGYPEVHGVELAEFLAPITLINGIGANQSVPGQFANGMGCLAAQLIAHFKTGVGGIYLNVPDVDANIDAWQEYEYHVYHDHVKVLKVLNAGSDMKQLFSGSWKNFAKWCNNPTEEEEVEETSDLRTALKNGIVTVTFTKGDGTTRVMRCTTNVDYLPKDAMKGTRTGLVNPHFVDPHLFKVWDVEAKDWRSFREERVQSFVVKK